MTARADGLHSDAPDLIVLADRVHLVDPTFSSAQAFAVRQGRFSYVGSREDALALRGRRTRIVDFSGYTVLPGLIDAHLHLVNLGLALQQVDLYGLTSFDDVVRATVAFARSSPDAWIIGDGWDQNLWPGKAFPSHRALSAAIPDRPVVLSRVDGHALLANAKAMQLGGISSSTPNPPGGRILHSSDGQPTGVFVDNAMDLIENKVPEPTHAQLVRAVRNAVSECNGWGLTGVAEPGIGTDRIAAEDEVLRSGDFSLRNYAMLWNDTELLQHYFTQGPQPALYDGRLWIRSVKMFADGALGSRGAALLEPYSDDPGNTGLIVTQQEEIREVCERALRAGFQTCVHAIGDRANRMVLDAYETALATVPSHDPRLRTEHAQVLSPQDIPRFAQLGIIPSMQTTHQTSDMPWAQARLGAERIRGAYAWRSLLDTGVLIANGTDAPVELVNPLRTFHSAITRQDEHNDPTAGWYPDQCMTREEGLKSMTIWAARANFQEDLLGSISPGKYADFVVMDRDWMTVAPDEIMATRIMATYLDGEAVYVAPSSAQTSRDGVALAGAHPRHSPHGHCCEAER